MSIFVIGDRDTVLGISLVGGGGQVVTGIDEARCALESALERPGLELVMVTAPWAQRMQDRMQQLKMTRLRPVVMEVPGKMGATQTEPIRKTIGRIIGIRL